MPCMHTHERIVFFYGVFAANERDCGCMNKICVRSYVHACISSSLSHTHAHTKCSTSRPPNVIPSVDATLRRIPPVPFYHVPPTFATCERNSARGVHQHCNMLQWCCAASMGNRASSSSPTSSSWAADCAVGLVAVLWNAPGGWRIDGGPRDGAVGSNSAQVPWRTSEQVGE